MVVTMSLISMLYYILLLSIVGLLFTSFGIYIIPIFLYIMLYLIISIVPLDLAWSKKSSYRALIIKNIIYIIFAIIIYSILYYKNGLILNGKLSDIDMQTAIYFSGTTWTTVGYGDISAPKNIRLLTTIEALNSYFSMAVLMALIMLWLNDAKESSKKYMEWIRNTSKEDIEEETGININEFEDIVAKKQSKNQTNS